jgi:hypothetical protein
MTPPEKELLEAILEQSLGITRREPAVLKAKRPAYF